MTKKLILFGILAISLIGGTSTMEARPGRDRDRDRDDDHRHHHHRDRYDRHDHHHHHGYSKRTRTLYFIERGRPVSRVVYVHPSGYYYRMVSGRPVRIRERYYTSYPSRYFHPDGRRRVGITFSF